MNQGDAKTARTDSMSDAGSSSRRQGMLAVNDLTYLLEPDLSVAVNVTHKNHFFQSNSYTNSQRAVCILNSGADYIDTRDSYLQFDMSTVNEGKGFFGAQGSVVNIIKTITISTRSGDEISRIVDCNRLNNMINNYRFSRNWIQSVGQTVAHGRSHLTLAANDKTTYCIPLYLLSDFFGYGRLLPSMIMSGLRIEIEFETSDRAFIHSSAATVANKDGRYGAARCAHDASDQVLAPTDVGVSLGAYTIDTPMIVAKSVQLTDATQRALNELSATNGLEIVYTDYERTETQVASGGKLHVEVRKACSRALQAYARVRLTKTGDLGMNYERELGADLWHEKTGAPQPTGVVPPGKYLERHFDSFASEPLSQVKSYQWQLGSLYFPQQPIKGENVLSVAKAGYCNSLIALNKFGPHRPRPDVPFSNKADNKNDGSVGDTQYTEAMDGHTRPYYAFDRAATSGSRNLLYEPCVPQGEPGTFVSYGQTWVAGLERSSMFELAGVPINNSRVLALHMEMGIPLSRTVDVYLKYVKLARVFLNNVEVEQ